jgi:outer membrane protein OmpA-like peptidoglycan-associated protein
MEENTTMKLNIIGHTDSDGSDADNLSLSQQRAEAVKTALVNDFNIPADRLSVEGKGESQPIVGNESPEDKAANRRVEFVSL